MFRQSRCCYHLVVYFGDLKINKIFCAVFVKMCCLLPYLNPNICPQKYYILFIFSFDQGTDEPLHTSAGASIEMNLLRKMQPIGHLNTVTMGGNEHTSHRYHGFGTRSSTGVDTPVHFSSLMGVRGGQILPVRALQLNNYPSVTSCIATDNGLKMSVGGALTTTTSSMLMPNVSSSQLSQSSSSITLTTSNGGRTTILSDSKYTQNIQVTGWRWGTFIRCA